LSDNKIYGYKLYAVIFGILFFGALGLFFKSALLPSFNKSVRIIKEKSALNKMNTISSFQDGSFVALCGVLQPLDEIILNTPFSNKESLYYRYNIKHTEFKGTSENRNVIDYSGFGYIPYGININNSIIKINAVPKVCNDNVKLYDIKNKDIYNRAILYIQSQNESFDNVYLSAERINTVINSSINGYDGKVIYNIIINNKSIKMIDEMYISPLSSACVFGIWDGNSNELNKENNFNSVFIILGNKSDSEILLANELKSSMSISMIFTAFIIFMSIFFIGVIKRYAKGPEAAPIPYDL